MPDYVLADSAEDDLEKIADYTIARWGVNQARRYGTTLTRHFEALAAESVKTQSVFDHSPRSS